uniref:Small ArfGAP 1 n=1 Tax=Poecilia formosa TaxID=48698 RepID=A0A096MCG7_POEFO
MTTRSEREKAQKLNEQHQAILSKMLREEDNKYCADCEAKGPRWASWNLGVFICIRCAGIHRNLGVHISRVKSVNLDQWTSEQIQDIKFWGNLWLNKLWESDTPVTERRIQKCFTVKTTGCEFRIIYRQKKTASAPFKSAIAHRPASNANRNKSSVLVSSCLWLVLNRLLSSRYLCKRETRRNAAPSVEAVFLLSATDTPAAAASANNGSTSTNQNNDLDIFGPMVSNPLPSSTSAAQFSQASSGSGQADLDLFSDSSSAAKAEDGTKKPLSKDSILSLYGTNSMSQQVPAAGMFMGPSQMQFPVQATPGYQAFPGMGAAVPPTTVMGAMMAQSGAAMMGPNPAMMVGMTMPNGFMGNAPATGMMGMAPRMMGPQGAPMPAGMMPAQGMYAIQPGQQAPWNMGQVNQQMSGMTLNGAGGQMAFGQPPSAMGGWAAAAGSGQTLSTQLWKKQSQ